MTNIKDLNSRIKSISVVLKVAKAVKVIANIRLAKLKSKIKSTIEETSINLEFIKELCCYVPLGISSPDSDLGIIIFSSKGLCGSYNTQIHKYFLSSFETFGIKRVITLGNKGNKYGKIYQELGLAVESFEQEKVHGLIDLIKSSNGCKVFYNHHKNLLEQIPTHKSIDIDFAKIKSRIVGTDTKLTTASDSKNNSLLIIDGQDAVKKIKNAVLKKYLYAQIKEIITDADLSEQSTRVIVVDNSIENAKTLKNDLQILLNKTRQNNITNQIIEVVSASNI